MRSPHAQHPVIPVHLAAGTLTPRPWGPGDAAVLTGLFRDEALRRWTSDPVCDEAGAARWVAEQQRGRETGDRLAFAVEEARAPGAGIRPAGHVALKRPARSPVRPRSVTGPPPTRGAGRWPRGRCGP